MKSSHKNKIEKREIKKYSFIDALQSYSCTNLIGVLFCKFLAIPLLIRITVKSGHLHNVELIISEQYFDLFSLIPLIMFLPNKFINR